ncbi:Predicted DNA-binding transcriptional regulator YafY, contains an HTH and WYL domains [Neorhodopirellula lusitana]|uniref:Predicted DNA-binding transcriptional regulator YafY, contains an HTH and WYL domains n=1 Tax=Neorhodopirellula lusitana TaxID=445327 RepID=A0ABY1PR53_9BACT|nr:transcriptional regulator [Neorhodopirellula lusitana]SMP41795.1 Predicted DNA-binding transcriptional regulator YafY, contains an HTH and WYL domains [Neorhodopirellula lusitana]
MAKKSGPKKNIPERPDGDRRIRQSLRIARVLHVLNLIQSRGRWNVSAIAKELGCSNRTVHRDLNVLEFCGVPFYFSEEEQCYRVRSDFRFPTLALTDDEVLGQAIATAITQAPGLDIGLGATPTTTRLASSSKDETKQIIADAMSLVDVFDLKLADHSQHGEILKTVQLALLGSNQVTGVYESPYEDSPIKLTVHPYRLCLVKQAWYIIGHIEGETEAKTFRAARFKSLRQTKTVANRPEKFDLRKHFGNAWSVFRGSKSYDVELRFDASVARTVVETHWHHTQTEKKHRDGSVTLKLTVDGIEEIQRWVLGWTGSVKVLRPLELKDGVIEKLEKGVADNSKYSETT